MKRKKFFSRRRPGHARRKSGSNLLKIALAVVFFVAVIGTAGFAMYTVGNIETADARYCFEREDQHQVAVLIDNSLRGLTERQLRDYETGLMREFSRAPANAKLMFFTTAMDAQSSLARPVFTVCKPAATAAEREWIGAPSKPGPFLRRQLSDARALYEDAVADVIAATKDDARLAGDSPILELIQAVSKYDEFQNVSRSLAIITDSLQRTETAQFCSLKGHMPPYSAFRKSQTYRVIQPKPLTGVDVTVLFVPPHLPDSRLPFCQPEELANWLPTFFKGNGAASVDLNRLRAGVGS